MKKICSLLTILSVVFAYAQKATFMAEPFYGEFKGNAPTYIALNKPANLEEKTRGFARVNTEKITVEGKIADDDGIKSVMVNNFPVVLDPTGTFTTEVGVVDGENTLSVTVLDNAGNEFTKEYKFVGGKANLAGISSAQGKYYALLIGIDEYDDPDIVDLDKPVKDAESLANVLKDYYSFEEENMQLIKNASRGDIITALDNLRKTITPNDNLLIFYAGHGLWDETSEQGYWIPADGTKGSTVDYFRNSTLTDLIGAIKSRHTLLIADACFSGAIFKSRRAFFDANAAVNKLYELPSRKAMTSGTLTEVPDRSAFLEYMIKRLKSNSEKYLTAATLFSNIRETVINNSDVLPQYGTIQKVGDEGGEFIFIRKE